MHIETFFSAALCVSDKVCDYVPLLSTLTNTVDLIGKAVLWRKSKANSEGNIPGADEVKEDNLYGKQLKSKSIKRCLIASVPVAGNGAVLIYDLSKGASKFVNFCIKQYKLRRASTEREAPLDQETRKKAEVKKDESSTTSSEESSSSDDNSSNTKPNQKNSVSTKPKTNSINDQGLSAEISTDNSNTSSEGGIRQQPEKKTVNESPEIRPDHDGENHATSTEEDSSSHRAETTDESGKSEEASEISESSSTEEEPIGETEPVPSAQNLTVFFESELKAKLTHTETILDENYGDGHTITTQTFTFNNRHHIPIIFVTTYHSSPKEKPFLVVRMEHFQKDIASVLSLKRYLDFLDKEKLIDFDHSYGMEEKTFRVICRCNEATKLAVRMLFWLAKGSETFSWVYSLSSTLDVAQLQTLFLEYLFTKPQETENNIYLAFIDCKNTSEIITTKNNPYFKKFIEKFSEHKASITSLDRINKWLTCRARITEGAQREIYIVATNYLLKALLAADQQIPSKLSKIMKNTKINSGETPDKKLPLASTTFKLMSAEQAIFLLDRLCNLARSDSNSGMSTGFWKNLILPLIQELNEKIKEENDSEREEYSLPIIFLNKRGNRTEELLFPQGFLIRNT